MIKEQLHGGMGDIERKLLSGEGFGVEAEPFAQGSWGSVYRVEAPAVTSILEMMYGTDIKALAVKIPKAQDMFVADGLLAEQCVLQEVECGLRQSNKGVPPALLGCKAVVDNGLMEFRSMSDQGTLAVVMPYFSREQRMDEVIGSGSSKKFKRRAMKNLFKRLELMGREVAPEDLQEDPVRALEGLIVDSRMSSYTDPNYPFSSQARAVNEAVSQEIWRQEWTIRHREVSGKIREQHGDPRIENIMLIQDQSHRPQAVVLDAVRLSFKGSGRIQKEWFITDDMLQAGMVLGRLYSQERYGWFRAGVRAYEHIFGEDVTKDTNQARLFGLSLLYGISIETHVLSYGLKQSDQEGWIGDEASLRLLDEYWSRMIALSQQPENWRDVI